MNFNLSKYVEISESITKNGSCVVFSLITGLIILISEKELSYINQKKFELLNSELFKKLKEFRIIIPEGDDEISQVIFKLNHDCNSNNELHIVIHPTAECQLRCSYCGQSHLKQKLSEQDIYRIVEYIESKLKEKKYTKLYIVWFGGEPILAIEKIKKISIILIELSERYNCKYESKIVSNGFSLTLNKYIRLSSLNVKQIEITLDGDEKNHDSRRKTKKTSGSFQTIIKNLISIRNYSENNENNIKIILRINVDKENFKSVESLIDTVIENKLEQIIESIYLAPIHSWGNNAHLNSLSKEKFAEIEINFLIKQIKNGLKPTFIPKINNIWDCITLKADSLVFDANGDFSYCTEVPYTPVYQNTDWFLKSINNNINIEKRNKSKFISTVLNAESKCRSCKYLPICGGGCPKLFLEGHDTCTINKFNLKEKLLLYAYTSLKNLSFAKD